MSYERSLCNKPFQGNVTSWRLLIMDIGDKHDENSKVSGGIQGYFLHLLA